MSDFYDDPGLPSSTDTQAVSEPASEAVSEATSQTTDVPQIDEQPPPPEAKQVPEESPPVARFKSCRWREKQDTGSSYCAHRDVLPFAGKNGFNPEAWCPDCAFFKIKRTVKKRVATDYDNYY